MAVLKQGDTGMEVKKLQLLLNAELQPSPRLREDGDFGPRTDAAVRRFQQLRGLAVDGLVGPQTWVALGQRTTPLLSQPLPVTDAPWMTVAEAEVGIHEDALPGRHTARILEFHRTTTLRASTDETPWCSSFVNWVMIKSGLHGTNSALAKSWLNWGSTLASARRGAVTVIKRKGATSDVATGSSTGFHVAFYVSGSATHLRLLGGNQSDQVKYSNFALSAYDVKGYRWPT